MNAINQLTRLASKLETNMEVITRELLEAKFSKRDNIKALAENHPLFVIFALDQDLGRKTHYFRYLKDSNQFTFNIGILNRRKRLVKAIEAISPELLDKIDNLIQPDVPLVDNAFQTIHNLMVVDELFFFREEVLEIINPIIETIELNVGELIFDEVVIDREKMFDVKEELVSITEPFRDFVLNDVISVIIEKYLPDFCLSLEKDLNNILNKF